MGKAFLAEGSTDVRPGGRRVPGWVFKDNRDPTVVECDRRQRGQRIELTSIACMLGIPLDSANHGPKDLLNTHTHTHTHTVSLLNTFMLFVFEGSHYFSIMYCKM